MTGLAVVTGGAQGIGYAIAERLGADGREVAIIDVDSERTARAVEALRSRGIACTGHTCDVSQRAEVAGCMERVAGEGRRIEVVVNNAGVIRDGWIERISDEDWDLVLDVNLKGTFNVCRAALPSLREGGGGKIVNIASRAWLGNPGQANYSASKGGVVSLTRTLALELARFDINCNAVAPGLIDTPLVQGLPAQVRERLIEAQPTKRMGKPSDVAAAVAFLASDSATFITGQVLHVCGGKSVGLGI
jgi:NAD(P)-dependent dehydrogenase (short-subunit alcohol dehydrogenase family)